MLIPVDFISWANDAGKILSLFEKPTISHHSAQIWPGGFDGVGRLEAPLHAIKTRDPEHGGHCLHFRLPPSVRDVHTRSQLDQLSLDMPSSPDDFRAWYVRVTTHCLQYPPSGSLWVLVCPTVYSSHSAPTPLQSSAGASRWVDLDTVSSETRRLTSTSARPF